MKLSYDIEKLLQLFHNEIGFNIDLITANINLNIIIFRVFLWLAMKKKQGL